MNRNGELQFISKRLKFLLIFPSDETNAQDGVKERDAPIPPPRPRRKARTKKKVDCVTKPSRSVEEAKHDPKWFSSCKKLAEPTIPQDEGTTLLHEINLLLSTYFSVSLN